MTEEHLSKIFMCNVPHSIGEREFADWLRGNLAMPAELIVFRSGWGIASMRDPESAQAAIKALDGMDCGGRKLIVKQCLPRKSPAREQRPESVRRERPRYDVLVDGYGWEKPKPEDKADAEFVKDLKDKLENFKEGKDKP